MWKLADANYTLVKDYLALPSCRKIALSRMEKPAVGSGTFYPPPTRVFLHSPMLEKSSGPWSETFYIPSCQKIFNAGKVLSLGPDTVFLTFTEPRNQFQGIDSANLCSLAGCYDNPILSRFLSQNRTKIIIKSLKTFNLKKLPVKSFYFFIY